jgi:cytochrome bd-type quinol oxidase subunit 2
MKNLFKKINKKLFAVSSAISALALSAVPASAATTIPDLDTVTNSLVDGATALKTNAITIITVVITIFIVVFGIGWLMSIFKKKMSKAG